MPNLNNKSSIPAENKDKTSAKTQQKRVNWHEAATCAIQIDLRDYSHMLEFLTEYPLGKRGSYRIDLLLIKKLSDQTIPKHIAKIFSTFNLFEIKGLGSSLNTDCYYKTIGYACFLIEQSGKTGEYINTDISLSFLCMHYPRKLIKHLTKKRHLRVEKSAPGVYHIIKEIFDAQIIVTRELSPGDSLYMRCLTDNLSDKELVGRLADDYSTHREQDIYINYLEQVTTANNQKKGDNAMVCEGLLNLFGTSSEEIIARTKEEDKAEAAAFYQPTIDALSSKIDYLQNLLIQNNIPFNTES
ncbi:MAG: hypothetical protein K2N85_00270 [Lachnospiraceae bacterium]|nr:hypothetical protein [Lachnospiraceae bacterium]